MRTAIYARISEDHTGEALGVERQLADCRVLAERLGWEVVKHYDDNDVSAYSGKTRPGFEAMLEAMRGGEFGALICWHPDRLYRSMRDLERVIDIADERAVQLRTVTAGDLNLGTPAGRMLARILGSVARQEVEHKGERQRRANEQRRAAGKWVRTGLRKFAYTHDGQPYEPEASALRKAADDVLAGKSLRSIAIDWTARGLRTTRGNKFTSLQVRRTLINPLYAGLVTHREKVIGRGEWPAIIDETTHQGLVAYLSDPARWPAVSFEKRHMLSGVAKCGACGQALYAVYPGGDKRGIVYTCRPAAHVARNGALLDEYVEALVLAWFSQPKTRKRLAEAAQRRPRRGHQGATSPARRFAGPHGQAGADAHRRRHRRQPTAFRHKSSTARNATASTRCSPEAAPQPGGGDAGRRRPGHATGRRARLTSAAKSSTTSWPCACSRRRADRGSKTATTRRPPSGSASATTSISSRRRQRMSEW